MKRHLELHRSFFFLAPSFLPSVLLLPSMQRTGCRRPGSEQSFYPVVAWHGSGRLLAAQILQRSFASYCFYPIHKTRTLLFHFISSGLFPKRGSRLEIQFLLHTVGNACFLLIFLPQTPESNTVLQNER